ncbi:hypothetical protein C5167_020494, partial [Papaver somniferum]
RNQKQIITLEITSKSSSRKEKKVITSAAGESSYLRLDVGLAPSNNGTEILSQDARGKLVSNGKETENGSLLKKFAENFFSRYTDSGNNQMARGRRNPPEEDPALTCIMILSLQDAIYCWGKLRHSFNAVQDLVKEIKPIGLSES